MANFEHKETPSNLDTNWQKGAFVKSLINVEDPDPSYVDSDCTNLAFAWFRVESNMKPSQLEENERQQAIRTQLELKVINKYGMPYGMPMSKDIKAQIKKFEEANAQKSNKWMRKRQKLIDKKISKDMKKQKVATQQAQNVSAQTIIPNNNTQQKSLSTAMQQFIKGI
jgi:acyl-CoA synthetase (NDP forming)